MEVDGSQLVWRISIQKHLDHANEDDKRNKWTDANIYRVPHHYRKVNKDCFVPKVVSLGPYHSSNPKLREADPHKWRALHYMLKRNQQEIGLYLEAMMELEPKARSCYEGDISLNKNEFVEMMVLDGCFIIEFLLCMTCNNETTGYPKSDPFFNGAVFISAITYDMLLVENQIPLFVLERLGQLQKEPVIGFGSIPNRVIWLFNYFMSSDRGNGYDDANDRKEGNKGHHILDIVRINMLAKILNPNMDEKDDATSLSIPCISKLKETRVKFKAYERHTFCKVNFSNRTLQLTQLYLKEGSKTLFCNLIAYEQRHPDKNKFITGYFMFMSQLIGSTEDVQYLIERKIINSSLGSYDDVVHLFDDVIKNAEFSFENSYLRRIVKDINKHCDTKLNKWRADLIERYFKTPWSTISFVAASFLLVITFIETLYSVKYYYSIA